MTQARAQSWELPEGQNHPLLDEPERFKLVARWRAAMVDRPLTPAPTLAAVEWKKAQLDSRQIKHMEVDIRQVERAIEADEAFLASHPMRRKRGHSTKREAVRLTPGGFLFQVEIWPPPAGCSERRLQITMNRAQSLS